MHVAVVGGGPAGLYFALLLRKARPDILVTVYERNAANDTFGWGVVFSDQTLENFRLADAPTYDAITSGFAHWDDIDVHVHGRTITSSGHGFSGIARRSLLEILQRRAAELGVELRFTTEVPDEAWLRSRSPASRAGINVTCARASAITLAWTASMASGFSRNVSSSGPTQNTTLARLRRAASDGFKL